MPQNHRPIVMRAGRHGRGAIKRLRRGEGETMQDAVRAAHDLLAQQGKAPTEALTVVLLYEEKPKKRKTPMIGITRFFPES